MNKARTSQVFSYLLFSTLILLLVLFPVALCRLLNVPIAQGKIFSPLRSIVLTFCPPSDIYDMPTCSPIDVSASGITTSITFTVKYVGPYGLGVFVDNTPDDLVWRKHSLSLRMRLEFYHGQKLLLSNEVGRTYSFISGGKGNGIILLLFRAPQELPVGQPIDCKITVLERDTYLTDTCGNPKLFIHKWSEK